MEAEIDVVGPRIRSHPNHTGVQVVDPIEETQFTLLTPGAVEPVPCDTDRFHFPATTGATIRANVVETPTPIGVWVRDPDGAVVAEVNAKGSERLPEGSYTLELSTTRMKLQLAVEGELTVDYLDDRTRIAVDGSPRVHVGARSLHEHPAATVTTTDAVDDVMAAVSTLGSALKTTSCERSYPTLRGHPPLVERGSELSIPDRIERPETGVTLEVPAALEYVYPVASLAYYLGAAVEPGSEPRLVTDDWTYPLDGPEGFETIVERVLKQVFLLDCVTRTEGYYQVDMRERRAVAAAVDLDFAALYDRPLAAVLPRYLAVPFESLTDAMPTWKLTADVRPAVEHVSALPFLAHELAVVRCPRDPGGTPDRAEAANALVDSFYRDDDGEGADAPEGAVPVESERPADTRTRGRDDVLTRGDVTRAGQSSTGEESTIVRPAEADSIEQAYVGEGIPVGASKMTVDAYYRRLDFQPSAEPLIDVTVVCNDPEMADENVVSEIYGARDWIDFDIRFEAGLTTAELRALLGTETDFLHYIGHVDDEGIRCLDGYLDARRLETVEVSAFFLNACASYDQGRGLVENGAIGGIATKTDIINEAATSVGRTVAKLLNEGFSLAATVTLIEQYEQIGHHYLAIGDGSAYIVENESGTPHRVVVEDRADDRFDVSLYGYPNLNNQLGSIFTPLIDGVTEYSLNSGLMGEYSLSNDDLLTLIHRQELPVEVDGDLEWSSNITSL